MTLPAFVTKTSQLDGPDRPGLSEPAPVALPGLTETAFAPNQLIVGSATDPSESDADALADRAFARLRERSSVQEQPEGQPMPAGVSRALRRSSHPATAVTGPITALAIPAALRRSSPSGVRDAVVGAAGGPLPDDLTSRIEGARAAGRPLPSALRGRMEAAFETNLEAVRIHQGSEPARLNRLVSARAFTSGRDIFFGDGEFRPETTSGERVLAHEIAHVVQQQTGDRAIGRQHLRRILQTRKQLEAAVGVAKQDIGLGGITLKAMGTKYKSILTDVDAYHHRINSTDVNPLTARTDVELLDEFLERIQTGCQKYLQDRAERDERATWIEDLGKKAGVERQVIATLAGQAGALVGRRWVDVLPKVGGASGGLDIPPDAAAEHQPDPGLEGNVVKTGTIHPVLDPLTGLSGASTPLAKGANVIIHRTDNPIYVRVETYQVTGNLGSFSVGGTGYTLAANVKTGSVVHKKLADDLPIFTREPHPNDVNQGGLGDCYLVAALAAIAATTPTQIYDMLKDNGNGTVTVRLYSIVPPPGATVKYLTISKSVVSDDRKSSGAMWVPLLEKAYAALGQGSKAGIITTQSKSYAQIGDGGLSDTSFHILTGRPKKVSSKVQSTYLDSSPMWGDGQVQNAEKKGIDKTAAFNQIYGQDAEKTKKFITFAKVHGTAMNTYRTYEQFETLINDKGLDAEVAGPLLKDLRRQVPGRRGSGLYTTAQTELFDRIQHEINHGGYVAASTPDKIVLEKGGAKGKGHSGGEETGEGLVGQHAYSVTAAKEVEKEGVPTRKYIRVRNPWGDRSSVEGRGRVYKELSDGTLDIETDPSTLRAKAKAEFDMELTDFTKNFPEIYWG